MGNNLVLTFFSQLLVGYDVDVVLHTITEDDILENMPQGLSDENRFVYIYRQEVMRTAVIAVTRVLMVEINIIINFIFNTERSSLKYFLGFFFIILHSYWCLCLRLFIRNFLQDIFKYF